MRILGAEPEGVDRGDQLRAVAVGEQAVAKGRCPGGDGGVPAPIRGRLGSATQDLLRHRGKEQLLALEVPVQGALLQPEGRGEAAHRQSGEALLVEDLDRGVDDVLLRVPHATSRPLTSGRAYPLT